MVFIFPIEALPSPIDVEVPIEFLHLLSILLPMFLVNFPKTVLKQETLLVFKNLTFYSPPALMHFLVSSTTFYQNRSSFLSLNN